MPLREIVLEFVASTITKTKCYNNVFVTVHNEQHNCLYRVAVRGILFIFRSVEYVVNNYVTLSGIVLHALTDKKILN